MSDRSQSDQSQHADRDGNPDPDPDVDVSSVSLETDEGDEVVLAQQAVGPGNQIRVDRDDRDLDDAEAIAEAAEQQRDLDARPDDDR